MLVFVEGGKPENPKKTLGTRRGQTQPQYDTVRDAGIEPGPYNICFAV